MSGIGKIDIGESSIVTYTKGVGTEEMQVVVRNALTEYLSLIKYDQFINSETGDKTFINELGREIEKASYGYSTDNFDERYKAGKRLDKALKKNPIYTTVRDSFYKAYKEYNETNLQFRNEEQKRKDTFDKRHGFSEEIKVENIPEIRRDETVETKEKEDVERDD